MDEPRTQELRVESLGRRGEGLAGGASNAVHIPGALPGERVLARIDGDRGELTEILAPSRDRIAPICRHFGGCGGCATQHLGRDLYVDWKRDILTAALARARIDAPVGALVDAHGEGRRRATFHARYGGKESESKVGFMRARTHELTPIETCPLLAPAMSGAIEAAQALADCLRGVGKPLDINVTATLSGLDIDVRGCGALDLATQRKLVDVADRLDLARLSNHGEILIERRPPELSMGAARVRQPPGGFLQATSEGERVLAELTLAAVQGARGVADLFCGAGAFTLRLAAHHHVHAVEFDRAALAALAQAARATRGLRPVTCEARDLFNRPLAAAELDVFDAVVFDPPRAGAQAQSRQLAASTVPKIVAISCNADSFALDMSILIAGGYRLESMTPIDQFRFSPHVEVVGVLTRPTGGRRPRRARATGLLG